MAKPILSADLIEGLKTDKNFLDGQADKNVNLWSAYQDTAGIAPIDGTGGSPVGDVTLSLTSTNPISETKSFQLSKPAANRQGEGKSIPFTIDRGNRFSVQRVIFKYEVVSGTFNIGDGTTSNPSSVRPYIYDITNGTLIELQQSMLDGSGNFISEFQATDSTSYRLILHIADATTNAWTMNFDLFSVGPRELARGPMVQTVYDGTSIINGSTTNPTKGTIAVDRLTVVRMGKYAIVELDYSQTAAGAAGSGTYLFKLPNNLTMADSVVVSTTGLRSNLGHGRINASGADVAPVLPASVFAYDLQNLALNYNPASAGNLQNTFLQISSANSPLSSAFVKLHFVAVVPIKGWEENVAMSNDTGNRSLTLRAQRSATQSITNLTLTKVIFNSLQRSTGNLELDTSTGDITVKESGWYFAAAGTRFENVSIATRCIGGLYMNGVEVDTNEDYSATAGDDISVKCTAVEWLNAGEKIDFRVYHDYAGARNISASSYTTISVFKVQSPQTIGMAEKLYARYTTNNGVSLPDATFNKITYEDKVEDTHGCYSAGTFTSKQSQRIKVNAALLYAQTTGWTLGATRQLSLYKNGAIYAVLDYMEESSSDSSAVNYYGKRMQGTAEVPMENGETLEIYERHTTGGALNVYSSDSFYSYVEFTQVK